MSDQPSNEKRKLSRRKLLAGTGIGTVGLVAVGGGAVANRLGMHPPKPLRAKEKVPDLVGKSVLITGCSSGFGRVGAEHYARLGAKVFATMRNLPRPEATELSEIAKRDNLDITIIGIDVTDGAQVTAGVAKALELTDNIDVLINNAAIVYGGPIEVQDIDATRLMFETNVFGAQRLCRAVMPVMRANGGGHIFNVSSMLGRLIIPNYGQYSPTKFAIEALSEQMSYELEGQNIGVTIIQPGGYPTNIWKNQAERTQELKDRTPDSLLAVYPEFADAMGRIPEGAGGTTDPIDVPKAIAGVLALPPEKRPLRVGVHPVFRPQMYINKAVARQQSLLRTLSNL